jgi:hypothetical protein
MYDGGGFRASPCYSGGESNRSCAVKAQARSLAVRAPAGWTRPPSFVLLGQRLAQGHDDLRQTLGRFGRGGSRASAQLYAPGGIRCQVAIPPFVEPTFRAGQCPADLLYGVACQVSVDGSLSALFLRFRQGGLLGSLRYTCEMALCAGCHSPVISMVDAQQAASVVRTVYGSISFMHVAAACRGAWA